MPKENDSLNVDNVDQIASDCVRLGLFADRGEHVLSFICIELVSKALKEVLKTLEISDSCPSPGTIIAIATEPQHHSSPILSKSESMCY